MDEKLNREEIQQIKKRCETMERRELPVFECDVCLAAEFYHRDIPYLLTEIERITADCDDYIKYGEEYRKGLIKAEAENERLQAERDAAVKEQRRIEKMGECYSFDENGIEDK